MNETAANQATTEHDFQIITQIGRYGAVQFRLACSCRTRDGRGSWSYDPGTAESRANDHRRHLAQAAARKAQA